MAIKDFDDIWSKFGFDSPTSNFMRDNTNMGTMGADKDKAKAAEMEKAQAAEMAKAKAAEEMAKAKAEEMAKAKAEEMAKAKAAENKTMAAEQDKGKTMGANMISQMCPCLDDLPLAMSYVPMQKWRKVYEPDVALSRGTIFEELDLPFKGGSRK